MSNTLQQVPHTRAHACAHARAHSVLRNLTFGQMVVGMPGGVPTQTLSSFGYSNGLDMSNTNKVDRLLQFFNVHACVCVCICMHMRISIWYVCTCASVPVCLRVQD